jgi:Conjugative transposon protein TcpC
MVRRALLDRGDLHQADDEALPLSRPLSARPDGGAAHWRGAGGRWLVWVARAIVWAVILLIGYRGVLAIVDGRTSDTAATPPAASDGALFSVTMAEAYALQFGDVYLNFSPASAAARSHELARFVSAGTDPQLGWNGSGTQRVVDEQVAGVVVTGSHSAVVTLLARLSGGRLVELGVPIYAAHGGMIVSGNPAFLHGPAKVTPPAASQPADQATETALAKQLPAFFAAFASGDRTTLARFIAPGAQISGLDGAVTFGAIDSVFAPAGGSRRQISVTVTWQLPVAPASPTGGTIGVAPASLQMTYRMTVVKQGSSWDVQSIGASTMAPIQGPP